MTGGEVSSGAKAKYLQIADDLAAQIRSGVLAAGDPVPSESGLMERYGVASGPVRRAIAELRVAQLVETHHGRGSFVRSRPSVQHKTSDRLRRAQWRAGRAPYLADVEQAGGEPTVAILFIGPVEVPEDIARRLGVSAGSQVLARKRRYYREGVPTQEATSYLPWDVVQAIPEVFAENPGAGGIYARLEDHGHTLVEFAETVRARLASKAEVAALSLSPGSPVIHLLRNAEAESGRVVEVCDMVMAADQFVLDYRRPAGD